MLDAESFGIPTRIACSSGEFSGDRMPCVGMRVTRALAQPDEENRDE